MKRKDLVAGIVIGAVVVFFISSFVNKGRIEQTINYYNEGISSQTETVKDVAKVLGRGAATAQIEFVVPECPLDQMVAYDSLLSALDNGLTRPQLEELNELFNICGDVAANRRAGTALQLTYEVSLLRTYVEGKALLSGSKIEDTNIAKWEELAKKETEIANLFVKLVQSQDAIITTLLTGVSPTSINVENIRATAQKLREDLNAVAGEASTLRAELLK